MGANSKIEWCDHTFNPWVGCTKVSPGCKHCYAETMMAKRWGKVEWGPQGQRVRTSEANWRKPLAWDKAAAEAGRRARVFCGSLCDVFEMKDDQKADLYHWRMDLLDLVWKTPNLDWLLLTKRPQFAPGWAAFERNVWLGTSVENQAAADERVPALLRPRPAVAFLSVEPLLGPVDLSPWLERIDWVIVGGESGHGARPMHPDWVRALRDQCVAAGVPFFFKQWGAWREVRTVLQDEVEKYGKATQAWDDGSLFFRFGKKRAGRVLDGRTWDEFPVVDEGA